MKDEQFKYMNEAKKVFRYRFIIQTNFIILFLIPYPISAMIYNNTNEINIAMAALISIIIFDFIFTWTLNFIFWRCPKCKTHFSMRGMDRISHCPYCGVKLR
ncbi:hypothetical protein OW763_14455 [Clostridium aestuarii]|uniref:Zinc ribbon domain-containing protein n=1 Tax=Clostridium aestuarii TaxID=338193 RepID=A0ABT4D2R7_9CLOT|nr:hypothetical protein [Clostridium aestuarii]MCY6485533.1 hypothetical protein [Clostridium aestuarii]